MSHNFAADLRRGWELPADQVAIERSEHAVEQWTSRTGLDERAFNRWLEIATVSASPPRWVNPKHARQADTWLTGPVNAVEVACPLFYDRGEHGEALFIMGTAMTCLRQERALAAMGNGGLHIATIGARK